MSMRQSERGTLLRKPLVALLRKPSIALLRNAGRAAATGVRLLGPVLVPSWRFFDVVGPSPRIEYGFQLTADVAPACWHRLEFAPLAVSLTQMLLRLFFNAQRNDMLYLVSCCERVLEGASDDVSGRAAIPAAGSACPPPQREILLRALLHARQTGPLAIASTAEGWLRFRILEVRRVADVLCTEHAFSSAAFAVSELTGDLPAPRASP